MAKNTALKSASVEAQTKEAPDRRAASERKISKSEAARRAIAAGVGQPTEASAYIKSHFGLDMSPQHFSAVKSQMKAKLGKVTIKEKPESRFGQASGRGSQASAGSILESDLLAAMESMKPLVAALGVEKVKRLAELLG